MVVGGFWDVFFCLIFGIVVGIFDMIVFINFMFVIIMGFLLVCLVVFLLKCLILNLKGFGLCYIVLIFGLFI